MKIGIGRPMTDPPGSKLPDVDMALVGKIAEDLGFDYISYGHHTVRPLDEPVPAFAPHQAGVPMYQDPVVGFARATAMTTRLEVGSGVMIIPMVHPVVFAKQIASVDLYSGGRVFLGIGVGGASQLEIEISGGTWPRRWAYTREAVLVMKGLWSSERFEFDGEYFKIPPVMMKPMPAQKGGPPILLGSSLSDKMMPRMMEFGDGWMPAQMGPEGIRKGPAAIQAGRDAISRAAIEAGRDPASFQIRSILLGDVSRDDAKRYEDATTDGIAIMMPNISTLDEARVFMEKTAEAVL